MKKKPLARTVLEMALDLGDTPDWIDPEKKRKISQGRHPYAQNPAFPQAKPPRRPGAPFKDDPAQPDPTRNYSELITSHVYPEIIRKVQQYTGQNPRQSNPMQLMMQMQQALMHAVEIEQAHRGELEQAAVQIVLGLPEFRDAAEAIQTGALRVEANLSSPDEMFAVNQRRVEEPEGGEEPPEAEEEEPPQAKQLFNKMKIAPEEPGGEEAREMGLHVPQVKKEYDAEAEKRRFVNLLIQGAGMNKNYAYHQIADRLRQIDPELLRSYGKMMSIGELMYWVAPEEMLNAMMSGEMGGGGAGGMEEISYEPKAAPEEGGAEAQEEYPEAGEYQGNPDLPEEQPADENAGVWVVRAYAMTFPVLIQEIVKGLYEFLAHNEDDPEEVRSYAYGKSDTLAGEQWDVMKGPGVWRHLNHIVNSFDGAEYMGRVFRHLVTLSTGEFNRMMQAILSETPEGRNYIRNLIAEIKAEDAGRQEESRARRLISGFTD